MVFSWQVQQWQQLWKAKQEQRLSHALLLTGIAGTGKTIFAESFVRAYGCKYFHEQTGDHQVISAQCQCHYCRLITGKSHPNVLWLEPEKTGGIIKIDQVREVNEFVNQTSLQGEYRFVIINPANRLNINAANALLKTLEEPSKGAILILISDQASQLPATVLSRCQQIHFPKPQTELALAWLSKQLPDNNFDFELLLRLTNGGPLAAMQLAQTEMLSSRNNLIQILFDLTQSKINPIQCSATLQQMDLLMLMDMTLTWIMDLMRLKLKSDTTAMTNKDFVKQLQNLQQHLSIQTLLKFTDYLQTLRGQIVSGINLNKQLMIENILIRYQMCFGDSHVSR